MPAEPRYVDLQVNGYAGVDFNHADLSDADLHRACQLLREDGVAGVLATIITDELPQMAARLARIAEVRRRDALVHDVIWGLHIEGPFLNEAPGCVGAHPRDAVRTADVDAMKGLLEAADGLTRIVTLAPERDPEMSVIRYLAKQGVVASAGHCDPSLDELKAAIDAGLSMFTHLGNGCPLLMHRHDNIVQRVLSLRDQLTICFIADGVHVTPAALGNYLRLVGPDRAVCVTDAISAARLGPGRYSLATRTVEIGEDLVARFEDGSYFIGSTATMPRIAGLLGDVLHLPPGDVDRLVCENPRAALAEVR